MDVNESSLYKMWFATSKEIVEMDLWYKRIGRVNLQKLKTMQVHNVVLGLPKFSDRNLYNVCEAYQFGKQARLAFQSDRYM